MNKILLSSVAIASLLVMSNAASARDQIRIVGSSTVYPFTTVVAEEFGQGGEFKTPIVESTGTGGGFKLFCDGVGINTPDISNASRAIKSSEIENCKKNGVTEIIEVKVGYDGLVLAQSKDAETFSLTQQDIFLALAKMTLSETGDLQPNPRKTWKDVRPDLPDTKIEVLGPPPTSGTRDSFVELAMEKGAESFKELAAIKEADEDQFKAIAHSIREDGAYIDAGENDVLIVRKLEANPNSVGIFGFSFLDQNADKIRGIPVSDVEPTHDTIADGSYPISRPLYIYVKEQHKEVVPGIQEFVDMYVEMGEEYGGLDEKGLIPLPIEETEEQIRKVE